MKAAKYVRQKRISSIDPTEERKRYWLSDEKLSSDCSSCFAPPDILRPLSVTEHDARYRRTDLLNQIFGWGRPVITLSQHGAHTTENHLRLDPTQHVAAALQCL